MKLPLLVGVPMPKTFSELLREQLDKANMTPYRLRQGSTGLSNAAISKLMNDKNLPRLGKRFENLQALGVSCEVFAIEVDLPEAPDERGRGRPKDESESEAQEPKATTQPKKKKK